MAQIDRYAGGSISCLERGTEFCWRAFFNFYPIKNSLCVRKLIRLQNQAAEFVGTETDVFSYRIIMGTDSNYASWESVKLLMELTFH